MHNNKINIDAKLADKTIKLCPKCKKCWQLITTGWMSHTRLRNTRGILSNYYYDFPAYGKEKKLCKECKEKYENKNDE